MRALIASVVGVPAVSSFFVKGPGRALATRFVAGETLDRALDVTHGLARDGFRIALDFLGEAVQSTADAVAAADVYSQTIRDIRSTAMPVTLSLKPSQFGLDFSPSLALDLVGRIAVEAASVPTGVRLDMEDSSRTDATLKLWRELLARGIVLGVVLQAALRRSQADLAEVLARGGSVRLCKGAYAEPPSIAYPHKADVDRSYAVMLETLLRRAAGSPTARAGLLPIAAIATHDDQLIGLATRLIHELGVPTGAYEFQLLYGVRRDLQRDLLARGHPVRVYVPWGPSWYPYLSRRLAERPANLAFVASAVLKDLFGPRHKTDVTSGQAARR
jgi:proline dehydrogenase